MTITTTPEAFVFMKVGSHAGESFEEILERKNQEYEKTGRIFWGYGGTACHPLTQVQPFAKSVIRQHGAIYLLMQPIVSNADPEIVPATDYSADGINWEPIPKGIEVLGSRYALILDEITPGDLDIVTEEFEVGVGPSRGKLGSDYLKGRVDKACLCKAQSKAAGTAVDSAKEIKFLAKLQDPFAVLLR